LNQKGFDRRRVGRAATIGQSTQNTTIWSLSVDADLYGLHSDTNGWPYSAYAGRPCGYRLCASRADWSLGPLRTSNRSIGFQRDLRAACSGGGWTQQGNKLVSTGAVGSARQGMSVALSADGNIAIVGGVADGVGATSVFTRSGGHWTEDNKLVGTGAVGKSVPTVALSADGSIVMVGGSNDNGGVGAAWAFTRSGGGSDYQETPTPSGAFLVLIVVVIMMGNAVVSGAPSCAPSNPPPILERMHGGAQGSGGPERARNGNYKHGRYTAEMIATRRWLREQVREVRELTKRLCQL
jgi:hypothetical protein